MGNIKDIAAMANVSQSTVSIVLNGKGDEFRISQETREKVLRVAEEIGYIPQKRIRYSHTSHKNPTITMLVASRVSAASFSSFFAGLQLAQLNTEDHIDVNMQPYTAGKLGSNQILKGGTTDGLIITSLNRSDYEFLVNNPPPIPVVLYNHESEIFPSVCANNIKSSKEIARLFVERGHKKLMAITPFADSSGFRENIEGFSSGCYQYKADELLIDFEEYTLNGGMAAAKKIMLNKPDAVFFTSYTMATGTMRAFEHEGINFLKEFESVAVASAEMTDSGMTSLTTVNIPADEMIASAVSMIISMKNNEPYERNQQFPLDFVFRESCGDFPKN